MPNICYVEKKFRPSSLAIIEQANEIISEYSAQGFSLTLRQLYYQFVARDYIPNTKQSYDRIGSILNDARLAGLVDWNAIEDRTRNLQKNAHWDSPKEILETCARQFKYNKWEDQPSYCEVWIEKEALIGVIEPICTRLDVPYFACRGYSSQSEQWRASLRFDEADRAGKTCHLFHLGDHDPSGIDMTRDNEDRLRLFNPGNYLEVDRLALNMNQVEEYQPPRNPAKQNDARFQGYVSEYGESSWELDALEPAVISELIEKAIMQIIDQDAWDETTERQDEARARIRKVANEWEE